MQPFSGIRVLDLTQIYQGPYATFLMAMAGAEVVKIEPPAGERTRRGGGANTPLAFAMLNSNKRSLTLDLKRDRAKELFFRMVPKADVVVENFAPGTMERLGLGWEVLREINPRLIYGTATGYGISGPAKDQLAMDHTMQAFVGTMSMTGEADGPPARAGGQMCDIMGGIHLYGALVSALYARSQTGQGTLVEVAMAEAMYFTLASEYSYLYREGELPPRRGDKSAANNAPYGRYECRDGWVALLCVSEPQWQSLLGLLGREDLLGDPDYATGPQRHKKETEINAMISDWTAPQSRNDVVEQARAARIPIAPVRDIGEVLADPHMRARGMLHDVTHPDLGDVVLPSSPLRYSDYAASDLQLYPEPGADNVAILEDWLGLSGEVVAGLAADGVV